MREKIDGPHNWSCHQLREKGDGENEITQRSRRLEDTAINVEGIGEGMKGVKGDANREKNIEVRWMIDDADACEQPLEILEQEVSVFEESQHAQIHADAGYKPASF